MRWDTCRSVKLSKICVVIFALFLLFLDIGCYWLTHFYLAIFRPMGGIWDSLCLMILMYGCSIPAWMTLWSLWRMLCRMGKGQVFVEENVRDMRRTSWCCIAVALICAFGTPFYLTIGVVAAAAGFMGLIVRIVKNAFQQAIEMKDELDFTV